MDVPRNQFFPKSCRNNLKNRVSIRVRRMKSANKWTLSTRKLSTVSARFSSNRSRFTPSTTRSAWSKRVSQQLKSAWQLKLLTDKLKRISLVRSLKLKLLDLFYKKLKKYVRKKMYYVLIERRPWKASLRTTRFSNALELRSTASRLKSAKWMVKLLSSQTSSVRLRKKEFKFVVKFQSCAIKRLNLVKLIT